MKVQGNGRKLGAAAHLQVSTPCSPIDGVVGNGNDSERKRRVSIQQITTPFLALFQETGQPYLITAKQGLV